MNLIQKITAKLSRQAPRQNPPNPFWPRTLTLESSFACNLDCVMCPRALSHFRSAAGKQSAILLPEVFERVLPSAHRFAHVHLTGWGEPLVNPHLADYIRRLSERGCEVSFATNGTLLNEAMAARLLDTGLNLINVSCDAATRETYERIRGKGQFDALVRNLKTFCALRDAGQRLCHVNWIFVMMKSNLSEVPGAVALAGECGADSFTAKHMETALDETELHEALFNTGRASALTPEAQRRYEETMAQARAMAARFPRMQFVEHLQFDPSETSCLARPLDLVVVDHEGNLSPCCYTMPMDTRHYQSEAPPDTRKYVVGNVCETPLEDLIASERYQRFGNAFRTGAAPPACMGCLQLSRRPPVRATVSR